MRATPKIIISYDADGAGQAAAQRAIDILSVPICINVLRIPGAKDPDEFIKAKGAGRSRRLIEQSEGHNAYRLSRLRPSSMTRRPAHRVFKSDVGSHSAELSAKSIWDGGQMAGVTTDALKIEVKRAIGHATNERTAEHRAIRAAVQNAQPKDRALHYPDIRAGRAEEGILV
ncbi:MAG: toprim domain-containing protein [Butyricicoccus sp.]